MRHGLPLGHANVFPGTCDTALTLGSTRRSGVYGEINFFSLKRLGAKSRPGLISWRAEHAAQNVKNFTATL
jgi:hypothetical protein